MATTSEELKTVDGGAVLRFTGLTARADGRVMASLELDTNGESVNALSARVALPSGSRVFRLEDGSTIVNAWIERPTVGEDGVLTLAGIVPGGFSGGHGRIVAVVFDEAPRTMDARLVASELFRHDGLGTPLALHFATTSWQAVASAPSSTLVDRDPPEDFRPEVVQSPDLFGGRPTLVFSTEDKGSGMAQYEVLEVPAGTAQGGAVGLWRRAESPYLLTDPSRKSDIYVRAVDSAGNFRIVIVAARETRPLIPFPGAYPAAFGWFLVVLAVTILWVAFRSRARF